MKKTRLKADALQVESFELAQLPKPRVRGTVRAAEMADTVVRSCQTQQYDCTVQGGYTCDYGACVSWPCVASPG